MLSGYLHRDMSEQLSLLTEQLRDYGYRKPLYLLNNIGGVTKVPAPAPSIPSARVPSPG